MKDSVDTYSYYKLEHYFKIKIWNYDQCAALQFIVKFYDKSCWQTVDISTQS